jgi:hypothetical protein
VKKIMPLFNLYFLNLLIESNGFSSRYINDFNRSEPTYDYDLAKSLLVDETQIPDDLKNEQDDVIYPDPEIFHRRILNKTRFGDRPDESIIKICE